MNDQSKSVRQPHGPGKAYYNRLATSKIAGSPVLGCLCGWLSEAIAESWEEAGKMLDQHIDGALKDEAVAYANTMKARPATARR